MRSNPGSDLANLVSVLYRVSPRQLWAEKPWAAHGSGAQAEF